MTSAEDKALKERLRAQLMPLIGKTPPGIGSWSYNKTHEFIEAMDEASAAAKRENATTKALGNAWAKLKVYYE